MCGADVLLLVDRAMVWHGWQRRTCWHKQGHHVVSVLAVVAVVLLKLAHVPYVNASSLVDIRWSDLSGQFFVTTNLTKPKLFADIAFPMDGGFVEASLPAKGRPDSKFENNLNASCALPMVGWVLKRLGISNGADGVQAWEGATRYRIKVQGVGAHSRFRIGLTPVTGPRPGMPFYREWMADSDGCWVSAGVPDAFAELDGDKIWGAFGQDGWQATQSINMDVDLEDGQVRFSSDSTNGDELRFSLDGFAPLMPNVGGNSDKTRERRDWIAIKQSLALQGVQFEFESSAFGPDLPLGKALQSHLVWATPVNACSPQNKNAFKGAIMYAQRGECDFLDKALHAQAAGAIAMIVGDNNIKPYADKNKAATASDKEHDLVIMGQFGRDQDTKKVHIPSVFVSYKAHKYVMGYLRRGAIVSVSLQGPVYAPAHHGLHWRETGLVPSLWLAPEARVKVSLIRGGSKRSSTDSAMSNSESTQGQTSANKPVCRPLSYTPLALSERSSSITEGLSN